MRKRSPFPLASVSAKLVLKCSECLSTSHLMWSDTSVVPQKRIQLWFSNRLLSVSSAIAAGQPGRPAIWIVRILTPKVAARLHVSRVWLITFSLSPVLAPLYDVSQWHKLHSCLLEPHSWKCIGSFPNAGECDLSVHPASTSSSPNVKRTEEFVICCCPEHGDGPTVSM